MAVPLLKRQTDGLIVLLLIAVAVVLASHFLDRRPSGEVRLSHGDPGGGPVVVKLAGRTDRGGIYYLPERTTVGGLLEIAAVRDLERFDAGLLDRTLQSGRAVTLEAENRLVVGGMTAAERLALDLPIDVNRATQEDLMLVPGVGERTAEKIVAYRQAAGFFKRVDDLMKIPGIKEKKLSRLKGRFCIE